MKSIVAAVVMGYVYAAYYHYTHGHPDVLIAAIIVGVSVELGYILGKAKP